MCFILEYFQATVFQMRWMWLWRQRLQRSQVCSQLHTIGRSFHFTQVSQAWNSISAHLILLYRTSHKNRRVRKSTTQKLIGRIFISLISILIIFSFEAMNLHRDAAMVKIHQFLYIFFLSFKLQNSKQVWNTNIYLLLFVFLFQEYTGKKFFFFKLCQQGRNQTWSSCLYKRSGSFLWALQSNYSIQ